MNILYNHIKILKTLSRTGQNKKLTKEEIKKLQAKAAKASSDEAEAQRLQEEIDLVKTLTAIEAGLTKEIVAQNLVTEKRLGIAQNFQAGIQKQIRDLTLFERRNLSLNKTLGVSSITAGGFGEQLDKIAKELEIGGGQARRYVQDFKKIAPMQTKNLLENEKFTKSLFRVQRSLTDQLGIAPETANAIQLYGASLEGSTEDNVTNMMRVALALEKQSNLAGAAKAIFEDIGALGADIQMQFSRVPGSLEKAVLQARMLGTDFNTIASVGSKLLDIESSINSELEFQLLSGKRLVDDQGNSLTAALREATIRGDAAAATEAMQKIIEETGETLETNIFARQELAELTGITEGNLMKMVQQNRLLGQIQLPDGIVSIAEADPTALGQFGGQNLGQMAADQDIRSTMELQAEQADAVLTAKIFNDASISQAESIKKTRDEFTKLEGGLKQQFEALMLSADGYAKLNEDTFLAASLFANLTTPVTDLTKLLPGLSGVVQKALGFFNNLTKFDELNSIQATITGTGDIAIKGPTTISAQGGTNAANVNTEKNGDALVQLNDAILFDPNDRFNILASTSQGSLDKATTNVAGGGGPTAQEIASAVADAISGIQIVTRIDDINEAQARNNYNINAIT